MEADRESACSESYDGARKWMVDDLRENYLSVGMKPDHVRSLLGEPDDVFHHRRGRTETWRWATSSGFTRCTYLTVKFVNGRLAETDHYY